VGEQTWSANHAFPDFNFFSMKDSTYPKGLAAQFLTVLSRSREMQARYILYNIL